MLAKIKRVDLVRQYAFAVKIDGKEIFIHLSEVQNNFGTLEKNQMVEYTLGSYNGRECATKVYVLSEGTGNAVPAIGATDAKV